MTDLLPVPTTASTLPLALLTGAGANLVAPSDMTAEQSRSNDPATPCFAMTLGALIDAQSAAPASPPTALVRQGLAEGGNVVPGDASLPDPTTAPGARPDAPAFVMPWRAPAVVAMLDAPMQPASRPGASPAPRADDSTDIPASTLRETPRAAATALPSASGKTDDATTPATAQTAPIILSESAGPAVPAAPRRAPRGIAGAALALASADTPASPLTQTPRQAGAGRSKTVARDASEPGAAPATDVPAAPVVVPWMVLPTIPMAMPLAAAPLPAPSRPALSVMSAVTASDGSPDAAALVAQPGALPADVATEPAMPDRPPIAVPDRQRGAFPDIVDRAARPAAPDSSAAGAVSAFPTPTPPVRQTDVTPPPPTPQSITPDAVERRPDLPGITLPPATAPAGAGAGVGGVMAARSDAVALAGATPDRVAERTPATLARAIPLQILQASAAPRPAGQVFAAALAEAATWQARPARAVSHGDDAALAGFALVPTAATERLVVQPPAEAAAPSIDLTRDDGLQRVIDRIEVLRDDASATAESRDTRIRLVPDALGTIDVAVRRDGDRLHVHFTAEHDATRVLIADAQPRLTELAAARGVRISGSSIDSGAAGAGGGGNGAAQPQPRPAPRSPTRTSRPPGVDSSTDHRLA